jgi:quercetin dioxygenase-like cupin family protein
MRRAIVPLALVLALVTGAVLAELRLLLLAPEITLDAPRAATNLATVRSFYDAANRLLATGDAVPLQQIVAADFVDHTQRPGVMPDRDGLIRYLRAWHGSDPTFWLSVDDLAAKGDRVITVVEAASDGGAPASGLPAVAGRIWGTVDVLRLRSGLIVEHWGDGAGLGLFEPLLTAKVPVTPPVAKFVEVERRTYAADDEEWIWAAGPTLLLVEAGALDVALDARSRDPAAIVTAAAATRPLLPGEEETLDTGEALVVVAGHRVRLRADSRAPVELLAVWTSLPVASGPSYPEGSGLMSGGTNADASPAGRVVAGGMSTELPEQQMVVSISRVALAPQAAVVRHAVANTELVVIEAGELAVHVDGKTAWAHDGTTGGSRPLAHGTLTAGDGLMVRTGSTVEYHPEGDAPAVFLLINFAAANDG